MPTPAALLLLVTAAATSSPAGVGDGAPPARRVGFATSVAFAGGQLLVGRTGSPFSPAGAVHVFGRGPGGSWVESGRFTGTGVRSGDDFGAAMAVEGDLVAVGAPGHAGSGAVFVFARGGTEWRQVAVLSAPGGSAGDRFGAVVALSGGVLAIGAPARDSARGALYLFARDGRGTWSEGSLLATGASPGDRLGASVAVSGGRILVGVPGPGPGTGVAGQPRIGSARLYQRAGGEWREAARLVPAEPDSALMFGTAVALAEDGAAIGAPLTARGAGAVVLFRPVAGVWTRVAKLDPTDPRPAQGYGTGLAWQGDELVVGAPGTSPLSSGAVHVLARQGESWAGRQVLSVGRAADRFGRAMALAGDLLAVAGPGADFGEGTGWLYRRDPVSRSWQPKGSVSDGPLPLPAVTAGEIRCDSGRAGGFDCSEVDLLAFLPNPQLGAPRGINLSDIWGWTDPETGREYALVGRMDATVFVDVTDPASPRIVGDLPMPQGARANFWRDIKTYRDHAFIVADGAGPHGMQVFDLTRLRNATGTPVTFTEDAHYDRIASAHNIAINEETGFAYAIGSNGGGETCGGALHMIDIRDPKHPVFAGCFADRSTGIQKTGYTHDNQCVTYRGPDERYRGREICFNSSETAVGIADVTDKASPKPIAVAAYPNTSYAHQGWLTEDQRYFYLNDEGDETDGLVPRTRTLVWDMSNLEEPVLVKEFLGATAATDHNLYVRGRYMYQANYVAGLRVIDIADPANPKEVGYFDTVPWGADAPTTDTGAWSVYPYFRSGTLVVSSQAEGLFVLRYRPRQPLVP